MAFLLENLLQFGRLLRALGLGVAAGRMLDAAQALRHVDIGRRGDFYHALRTLLVHRAEDLPVFDEAFRIFWRKPPGERTTQDLRPLGKERRFGKPQVETPSLHEGDGSADAREPAAAAVAIGTFSDRETLQEKDFKDMTGEELAEAARLMDELRWRPGLRRSKRWRSGAGEVDLRRLLRRSARGGAEALRIPQRARKLRRRPLVLLCDVSGSMERYSSMLVRFAHALSSGMERVETFLFATRLTRVSQRLRRGRPDSALAQLACQVPDWSGGTRTGEALRSLNVHWRRRVLNRGPVVLLVSDGWDRGDPQLLRREIARLRRSCRRLIWLNPLLGSPVYEPLTRGMQAALPYVHDFMPVHNLTSLEKLAAHLNALSDGGRAAGT